MTFDGFSTRFRCGKRTFTVMRPSSFRIRASRRAAHAYNTNTSNERCEFRVAVFDNFDTTKPRKKESAGNPTAGVRTCTICFRKTVRRDISVYAFARTRRYCSCRLRLTMITKYKRHLVRAPLPIVSHVLQKQYENRVFSRADSRAATPRDDVIAARHAFSARAHGP